MERKLTPNLKGKDRRFKMYRFFIVLSVCAFSFVSSAVLKGFHCGLCGFQARYDSCLAHYDGNQEELKTNEPNCFKKHSAALSKKEKVSAAMHHEDDTASPTVGTPQGPFTLAKKTYEITIINTADKLVQDPSPKAISEVYKKEVLQKIAERKASPEERANALKEAIHLERAYVRCATAYINYGKGPMDHQKRGKLLADCLAACDPYFEPSRGGADFAPSRGILPAAEAAYNSLVGVLNLGCFHRFLRDFNVTTKEALLFMANVKQKFYFSARGGEKPGYFRVIGKIGIPLKHPDENGNQYKWAHNAFVIPPKDVPFRRLTEEDVIKYKEFLEKSLG